jgi:hypothetical protein
MTYSKYSHHAVDALKVVSREDLILTGNCGAPKMHDARVVWKQTLATNH